MANPPRRVVELSPGRQVWINALDLPAPAHPIYGLVEVDVTAARRQLAAEKARSGEAGSFTAFLIACLARAIDEHKEVQAYRKGRRQLVILDDVNVGMLIEHGGQLMGHVVARANLKTWREILDLTLMFDHEIVDGAPATRFTRRLIELIESGCEPAIAQAAS